MVHSHRLSALLPFHRKEGKTAMASIKAAAAAVCGVSAGWLVFWGRVKIFREAAWGQEALLWIWRSFPYPLSQRLAHKGSFHGNCIEGCYSYLCP